MAVATVASVTNFPGASTLSGVRSPAQPGTRTRPRSRPPRVIHRRAVVTKTAAIVFSARVIGPSCSRSARITSAPRSPWSGTRSSTRVNRNQAAGT